LVTSAGSATGNAYHDAALCRRRSLLRPVGNDLGVKLRDEHRFVVVVGVAVIRDRDRGGPVEPLDARYGPSGGRVDHAQARGP
jgi:hypothetical protein